MKGKRAAASGAKSTSALVVLVTASSKKEAKTIGAAVVEERLAACATVIGLVDSIYRWKGEVQCGREALMLVKTTARRYPQLEARIRALHSYEVPEIIALPVVAGIRPYLKWLGEVTAK